MRTTNTQTNNETGKFLTALLLGALVGAAVAVLTAPKSGEETRNEIESQLEDQSSRLRQAASRVASSTRQTAQAMMERADTLKAKGLAALDETRNQLINVASDGDEIVFSAATDLKDSAKSASKEVAAAAQKAK